jgi:ribosomal protein L7/L12
MTRCPFCNHQNRPDAARCSKCGADLGAAELQVEEGAPTTVVPQTQHAVVLEGRIAELLGTGQKIEAINLYRQETGAGFKEAKEFVEALSVQAAVPQQLQDRIAGLLFVGRKIEAIKIYRAQTGAGLKDAKEAVEAIGVKRGVPKPKGVGCSATAVLFIAAIGAVWWLATV